MYYTLEITGAAAEASIVSTADLKTFLRVDHSDEDTLIEALRSAAIEYVQNYCNVQLGDVTAVMYLDDFRGTWETSSASQHASRPSHRRLCILTRATACR